MDDKQSQCKRIVEYIREKGCITSLEAYQKLKVTQLAARITDHRLGKRGLCVCQATFEGGRLQAAGYALLDYRERGGV